MFYEGNTEGSRVLYRVALDLGSPACGVGQPSDVEARIEVAKLLLTAAPM
jgi:hypothetical protein